MATIEEMVHVICEGGAVDDLIQALFQGNGPDGDFIVKWYLRLVLSEAEENNKYYRFQWDVNPLMVWFVGNTDVRYYGIDETFTSDQLTDKMMDDLEIVEV